MLVVAVSSLLSSLLLSAFSVFWYSRCVNPPFPYQLLGLCSFASVEEIATEFRKRLSALPPEELLSEKAWQLQQAGYSLLTPGYRVVIDQAHREGGGVSALLQVPFRDDDVFITPLGHEDKGGVTVEMRPLPQPFPTSLKEMEGGKFMHHPPSKYGWMQKTLPRHHESITPLSDLCKNMSSTSTGDEQKCFEAGCGGREEGEALVIGLTFGMGGARLPIAALSSLLSGGVEERTFRLLVGFRFDLPSSIVADSGGDLLLYEGKELVGAVQPHTNGAAVMRFSFDSSSSFQSYEMVIRPPGRAVSSYVGMSQTVLFRC